jgi:hypothetical protein
MIYRLSDFRIVDGSVSLEQKIFPSRSRPL